MTKKTFEVFYSKAYYASGVVTIEADSEKEAYAIVDDNIGDYEGSMQYCPDDNVIEVLD